MAILNRPYDQGGQSHSYTFTHLLPVRRAEQGGGAHLLQQLRTRGGLLGGGCETVCVRLCVAVEGLSRLKSVESQVGQSE